MTSLIKDQEAVIEAAEISSKFPEPVPLDSDVKNEIAEIEPWLQREPRASLRAATPGAQRAVHEQVLLSVFLSVIVNVVPFEKICTEAVPLFRTPSILADTLRSGPLC